MPNAIDFYFDFSSPYAYFAQARIDRIGERHGRRVNWRPFMLGSAFKATGMVPLAAQPVRGPYAIRDWHRLARKFKLAFVLPAAFPVATLAPSRGFYWLESRSPELAMAYARQVFAAYFGEGRDVSQPEIAAALAAPLGVAPEAFLAAVQAPEWKQRLKDESEQALKRGVFGAPFIFVDGEPFWGQDRLDDIDQWLATGGW